MGAIAVLKVVLFVIVAIISLFNLVRYLGRRVGSKGALRDLRDGDRKLRTLSTAERSAIEPYLFDPQRPKRTVQLLDETVHGLEGEFVRHGLEVSQAKVVHETLGGVDVILPYDAREFLQPQNRAEVVLTAKYAVVVRLNDAFDLEGGRARAREKQADQRQWQEGKAGELHEATAEGENTESSLQILGQREETLAEAANRTRPPWGLFAILAASAAFGGLAAGGMSGQVWTWLFPSLICLALAVWLIWRPQRTGRRQKVNRVRGTLDMATWQHPENLAITRQRLCLGDKFPIEFPAHWRGDVPSHGQVTVDMRVEDFSVVTFEDEPAQKWTSERKRSIDEEERRFPSIHWGRHLVLALAGLAMSLVALSLFDHLGVDAVHVLAGVRGRPPRYLRQVDAALSHVPVVGDMVAVDAQLRCQLAETYGDEPPRVDCRRLRLGGQAPRVEDVVPDEALKKLGDGSFIKGRKNRMLDMMVELKMAQQGINPGFAFATRPSMVIVDHLADLVLAVDQVCTGARDLAPACSRVQDRIARDFIADEERGMLPWPTLVERAKQRGSEGDDDDDSAITDSRTVSSINESLKDLVMPLLARQYRGALTRALESQRGGLLLEVDDASAIAGLSPESEWEDAADWSTRWQAAKRLADPEGAQALQLTGLVVAAKKDAAGDPVLTLDLGRSGENYGPALLRLLAFLFALAILSIHGVAAVVNWVRADRRSKAIRSYYADRPR